MNLMPYEDLSSDSLPVKMAHRPAAQLFLKINKSNQSRQNDEEVALLIDSDD